MTAFLRGAALVAAAVASPAHADLPLLRAEVDTARVRLGDPVALLLRVERPASSRSLFPELQEKLGSWIVRSQSAPATKAAAGGIEVDERRYELTAFTLDTGAIPALEVLVVGAASDTARLRSPSIPMEIVSARDPEEGDALREIKPPMAIPGGIPLWLAGILAAAAAVLLAWLAGRFLLRRPKEPPALPSPPPAPVDYESEFVLIAESGLLQRGALKVYYTRLSEVMRRFLEDRLSVDGLDRTTSEIAADLRRAPSPPDADTRESIIDFLQAADLVKFARAEPPRPEAAAAPEEGRRLVAGAGQQLRALVAAGAAATSEGGS